MKISLFVKVVVTGFAGIYYISNTVSLFIFLMLYLKKKHISLLAV